MKILALTSLWLLFTAAAGAYDLTVTHANGVEVFTQEDLAALPTTEFSTNTPWTAGTDEYRGVAFQNLLLAMNLENEVGDEVRLVALNDYTVVASLALLLESDAMVAYKRNGEAMPVRAYGPFWLLFPFSERPELVNRDVRNVSVWQLKTIELTP